MPERRRNYRKEYAQETQERRDNRVARNRARREAIREGRAKVGDGTVQNHVKPLSKGGPKNGKTVKQSRKASNREGGRLRHE
jgi:hypothetical protein